MILKIQHKLRPYRVSNVKWFASGATRRDASGCLCHAGREGDGEVLAREFSRVRRVMWRSRVRVRREFEGLPERVVDACLRP